MIIYSKDYRFQFEGHVFPAVKYRDIYQMLTRRFHYQPEEFKEPEIASDEDLLLVHTPEYLQKLKTNSLSGEEVARLEIPASPEILKVFRLMAGGTVLAAEEALKEQVGIHIGGGFHHSFPDHGEGFCMLNDVAVAVRKLQQEKKIKKALLVDLDVHQGNGNAFVFRQDPDVYTFSIHEEENYPFLKPPGSLDVGLASGTGNDTYLAALDSSLLGIKKEFKPDIVFYVAGADPFEGDQLGRLKLSLAGMKRRDERVRNFVKDELKVPVVVTLAGGYAYDVQQTVQLHVNTIMTFTREWK